MLIPLAIAILSLVVSAYALVQAFSLFRAVRATTKRLDGITLVVVEHDACLGKQADNMAKLMLAERKRERG